MLQALGRLGFRLLQMELETQIPFDSAGETTACSIDSESAHWIPDIGRRFFYKTAPKVSRYANGL